MRSLGLCARANQSRTSSTTFVLDKRVLTVEITGRETHCDSTPYVTCTIPDGAVVPREKDQSADRGGPFWVQRPLPTRRYWLTLPRNNGANPRHQHPLLNLSHPRRPIKCSRWLVKMIICKHRPVLESYRNALAICWLCAYLPHSIATNILTLALSEIRTQGPRPRRCLYCILRSIKMSK